MVDVADELWKAGLLIYLITFIGALIGVRLLIGLFEAGFYPTCVSYLSFFYRRFDLAIRIAVFYGQYAIAGAFAGAICKSQ
jgi:MFS family permease